MASKRLAQETKFSQDAETDELVKVVQVTCAAGECIFFWIVEDEDGDAIELPEFCPCCGRAAIK